MKHRWLVLLGCVLFSRLAAADLSFGSAELIDEGWSFALRDEAQASQPQFDDAGWQAVRLPHDWSILATPSPDLASCTGYLPGGVGWYRKKLVIPSRAGGERVYLYFEGVYNRSEVYLNGHLLGKRPNGYVSFYYDATPQVLFDRENTIAVRVDHSRSADSRWYSGSGIYRKVFVIRSGPVHLAPWGVFAKPGISESGTGRVAIDTDIQNDSGAEAPLSVRQELLAADGAVIASATAEVVARPDAPATASQVLEVSQPHLWSLDDPYLYRVRTTLVRDGREIDRTITRTGIRRFAFDPNHGFSLNGTAMKMKGVCLHHDGGVLGAAVPRELWEKRLRALKSIGCNAVRMSHNPQAPDVYELCDEFGLLVLDEAFDEWEFPKRKWLRGWNVGEPGFEGSSDFFEEWSGRDVADMVRRDRNHPSIFAWSIGNEVDYPNDPYSHPVLDGARINQPMFGGYKPDRPDARRLGAIAQRLAAEVKKHDRTRPVTAALAGVVMSNETDYPAALDIVGYNYTEERYEADHARYPQRVLYGSENGHGFPAWKAVQEHDYIFGQFLWTGIDYLGEAGPWPSRGSWAGLLDFTGAVKPRGRFREALWSARPVITLGTQAGGREGHPSIDAWPIWNHPAGSTVRVFAYTNAPAARLLVNGRRVGDDQRRDSSTGLVSWVLPFEPGRLEGVGLDEAGAEVCRTAIQTADTAARIRVTGAAGALRRDRGLAMVEAQLVDAHGVPVLVGDNRVHCTVEGPARLLGLESGNLGDMTAATSAERAVHHGRLVAYVQATGGEGTVRVRFTSKGLPDADCVLSAR